MSNDPCANIRRALDAIQASARGHRHKRELAHLDFREACDPDTIRELLAERDQLAAALEAAREDAERLDWMAGDAVLTSGWREHGTWETPALLVNSTRETCAPRDFRAAIDQARGKGVA